MAQGLVFALAACGLWGAIYMVPTLLPEFSPLQITFARFGLYGVVALCIFAPRAARLRPRIRRVDLLRLAWLALVGNIAYFAVAATAVQWVGVPVTSLIVGLVPVLVPLMARHTAGSLPLRHLAMPLLLIVLGIVTINSQALGQALSAGGTGGTRYAGGVFMAVLALLAWSRYAIDNNRFLRDSSFNGSEWSTLWGLVVGVLSLVLAALWWWLAPAATQQIPPARWQTFWLLCLGMAIFCSWLGNLAWNAASVRLPVSLMGQLVVFETLFTLLYHFAWERRLPDWTECLAMALILTGIGWSLKRFAQAARGAEALAPAPAAASTGLAMALRHFRRGSFRLRQLAGLRRHA